MSSKDACPPAQYSNSQTARQTLSFTADSHMQERAEVALTYGAPCLQRNLPAWLRSKLSAIDGQSLSGNGLRQPAVAHYTTPSSLQEASHIRLAQNESSYPTGLNINASPSAPQQQTTPCQLLSTSTNSQQYMPQFQNVAPRHTSRGNKSEAHISTPPGATDMSKASSLIPGSELTRGANRSSVRAVQAQALPGNLFYNLL